MQLKDQQIINLPLDTVWAALNDPAILQQCVPGCDTFEPAGENQYKVVMRVSVGPIQAKFTGKLHLSDIVPPESYKLSFEGSGGAAGSGKGDAAVQLIEVPEGTRLEYAVMATVGGKLAQVGTRLINGVAKKMADQFFSRLKALIEPIQAPTAALLSDVDAGQTQAPVGAPVPRQSLLWPAVAGAAVIIGLIIYLN
ncbi:carbon monoxide dehydrogenase subunit G [Bordetella sp. BOR01]|uniref:CoxG family protein n=1 Tax=Bordetella sp. BOR01 TaxID=2854779 RepID=UPI001C43D3C2|nr:carbon monoxide dehydrogenase subunit G [Bordetella sp. BOR01]